MNLTPQERLNARILIVDDQPANVSLLEEMLQEAGYTRVSSTMEPEQVCAMHRKAPFDLILLDLQMPGMDGFQVMEGLKASTAEDDYLPVLVITAQPGHKLRALQAGAKDFISKPFDLVEVKMRIHNMLEVRLLYRKLENYSKTLEEALREMESDIAARTLPINGDRNFTCCIQLRTCQGFRCPNVDSFKCAWSVEIVAHHHNDFRNRAGCSCGIAKRSSPVC